MDIRADELMKERYSRPADPLSMAGAQDPSLYTGQVYSAKKGEVVAARPTLSHGRHHVCDTHTRFNVRALIRSVCYLCSDHFHGPCLCSQRGALLTKRCRQTSHKECFKGSIWLVVFGLGQCPFSNLLEIQIELCIGNFHGM